VPNRILREGILTSERVNALSPPAELFYRRLMSIVDDYGRFECQINVLLARGYPLALDRVSPSNVREWLTECCQQELITEYSVNGKTYLQINNFGQRERSSKYPAPPNDGGLPSNDRAARESAAYARASTPTPTTPPNSSSFGKEGVGENPLREVALVPAEEFRADLLENLLGLFIALGRGIGITDRVRCENSWKGLNSAERISAHNFAMSSRAEWQTRPTNKIAHPWNYLEERHWERAAPRLLPQTRQPSKSEDAQKRAAQQFEAEQKAAGA
jgi:hypothetical protein